MIYITADLSKAGAARINVENAQETVKRLPDERAPVVATDGQSARRVRGREPGHREMTSQPAHLDAVVGLRRRIIGWCQREHPGLGRFTDQHEPRVRSEDADDVRL